MRIFGRSLRLPWEPKAATLASPEGWLVEALLGQLAASGVRVTPLTVMGIPTVLACVNRVSGTMACLPVKLFRRVGEGSVPATEHYLYNLISTEPVPGEMTSARMRRAVQATATLRNQAWTLINRNGLDEVAELVPIEPQDFEIRDMAGKKTYWLKGQQVSERDLLSITGLTFNGLCGADPLRYAKEAIGLTIALQDNAARFFANGSRPGGILSHPNSLSEEAQDRLRKKMTQQTSGKNAYALMVLEEGLTYTLQRETNQASQFTEQRKQQDEAICRIFGVPQSKAGIMSDAHYNNVEQENQSYVTDCILPWVVEWEQTLSMKLLRPEEKGTYFFKFNLAGLLRGDLLSRYQSYAIGRNWGWLNVDEIRAMEELNPLPDGDGKIYLQPLNMQEAGAPLDQPTSPDKAKKQPPKNTPTT
jgi:HK97 family phage portal protein